MKSYLIVAAVYLAIVVIGVGIGVGLVTLFPAEPKPMPVVECIEGLFMEQLKPDVETFGAFQGYICGENLDYVWGTPPGLILNSGLSVEDFN